MQEWYDRQYSPILNRDMEHALIGHDGKLCLAFAPQNGHTWDFRNFGMVETVRPWIDAGRLKILLVDSIDEETWSDEHGDGRCCPSTLAGTKRPWPRAAAWAGSTRPTPSSGGRTGSTR